MRSLRRPCGTTWPGLAWQGPAKALLNLNEKQQAFIILYSSCLIFIASLYLRHQQGNLESIFSRITHQYSRLQLFSLYLSIIYTELGFMDPFFFTLWIIVIPKKCISMRNNQSLDQAIHLDALLVSTESLTTVFNLLTCVMFFYWLHCKVCKLRVKCKHFITVTSHCKLQFKHPKWIKRAKQGALWVQVSLVSRCHKICILRYHCL